MEKLGLTPVMYSALTVMPIALGIVTPLVWGKLWDRWPWAVLVGAPMGELFGAILVALGLAILHKGLVIFGCAVVILGLIFSSACRAGITIAEFSTCGSLGDYSVLGFGALVLAKHFMGVIISWGVPRLVSGDVYEEYGFVGLFRAQAVTLIPHGIALAAGVWLMTYPPPQLAAAMLDGTQPATSEDGDDGYLPPPTPSTPAAMRTPPLGRPRNASLGSAQKENLARASSYPNIAAAALNGVALNGKVAMEVANSPPSAAATPDNGSGRHGHHGGRSSNSGLRTGLGLELTVILIGLWRALEVGTLHAYHSIRIELALNVSPLSLVDAGTLFARNDALAIAALPLMYFLGRAVGLRALLVAVPLLSVAAVLAFATMATPGAGLSFGTHASLLCMSILEIGLIMLLGVLRQGLEGSGAGKGTSPAKQQPPPVGPIALMAGGFAAASAVSCMLARQPQATSPAVARRRRTRTQQPPEALSAPLLPPI